MSSIEYMNEALKALDEKVMMLLEDMTMSQSQKNEQMAGYAAEKKILVGAKEALETLQNEPIAFKACGSQVSN